MTSSEAGQPVVISLHDEVGSEHCVSTDDGQTVHAKVLAAFRSGVSVTLTFRMVETITSAFLNAAVGQLLSEFSREDIEARLNVVDILEEDEELLKRVITQAQAYFADPDASIRREKDVLGEDEDDGES